ncbi:MAG: hypothetical protein H0X24_18475 [Ktedonobacterales bacterium]|nr:hypothetical protein [Ktedonobacterales bacterium]
MVDELSYNRRSGCYEGETSDGKYRVSVSRSAMAEARHIAALEGKSTTDYLTWLYAPDTWAHDPILQDTDGVEIEDL